MLTIYHVRGTRSVRPIWLCYELGLPVEIISIDFSRKYRNTPEWRAISPAGKVPAMRDGDLTIFESGAIVEYILERYGDGRLRPPHGTMDSALYLQWSWFSEATLARPLGVVRIMRHESGDGRGLVADAAEKTRSALEAVDRAVSDQDYIVGSAFTAADIMMGYSLKLISDLGGLDDRYPVCLQYLNRLRGREGFQRAFDA
jgi:glutathione S-transferase